MRPQQAADACWQAIREALHKYPTAKVMLVFRVPKSVGLAVGSLLATKGKAFRNPGCGETCRNQSCSSPWSRLLPLNWVGGSKPYEILRVHRWQPSTYYLNSEFDKERS